MDDFAYYSSCRAVCDSLLSDACRARLRRLAPRSCGVPGRRMQEAEFVLRGTYLVGAWVKRGREGRVQGRDTEKRPERSGALFSHTSLVYLPRLQPARCWQLHQCVRPRFRCTCAAKDAPAPTKASETAWFVGSTSALPSCITMTVMRYSERSGLGVPSMGVF
jgi:hypothetical protein